MENCRQELVKQKIYNSAVYDYVTKICRFKQICQTLHEGPISFVTFKKFTLKGLSCLHGSSNGTVTLPMDEKFLSNAPEMASAMSKRHILLFNGNNIHFVVCKNNF